MQEIDNNNKYSNVPNLSIYIQLLSDNTDMLILSTIISLIRSNWSELSISIYILTSILLMASRLIQNNTYIHASNPFQNNTHSKSSAIVILL